MTDHTATVWPATDPSQPPLSTSSGTGRSRTVLGALNWLLTPVYIVVQPIVAAAWEVPYDIITNSISDLGVSTCAHLPQLNGRVVYACSPRHALMNATFVAAGLLTTAGAILLRRAWPRRRATSIALTLIALSGVGGILVGLSPADVNLAVHGVGALLQVPAVAAPFVLGVAVWRVTRIFALFSLVCGVVGAVACVLYLSQIYLTIGPGVMERLAVDPLTLWMAMAGAISLRRSIIGASH